MNIKILSNMSKEDESALKSVLEKVLGPSDNNEEISLKFLSNNLNSSLIEFKSFVDAATSSDEFMNYLISVRDNKKKEEEDKATLSDFLRTLGLVGKVDYSKKSVYKFFRISFMMKFIMNVEDSFKKSGKSYVSKDDILNGFNETIKPTMKCKNINISLAAISNYEKLNFNDIFNSLVYIIPNKDKYVTDVEDKYTKIVQLILFGVKN